ncbi:zinc phosphodiesterase, putative tRNA 3' processing RNase Z homolog [Cupriavidus taiwanensis]|nr:zinc phosphodiesterase, putative tRNA 3' processing RNase Z homolog [Cupriavidus taiwanensis]SOY63132.1 zinc phosphodiesterase, putative tRNA 3' processing RNase Z homolog [Cupriavidus taiwanensis]SOY98179.1 zinc phosphodiesterase, putative tRNA 3' processing RNase Z homolog [Cupriavidus taiwanensis]SOZ77244.1 zinc phosphodiesterase, putative tRNA 3' processing RNase Z homolog [Cupriavidus taiwanensis]SOZ85260.1 zinc phosphodiesterase, putative tRNA 3' processing RNase Z homolog [Cupriavidus
MNRSGLGVSWRRKSSVALLTACMAIAVHSSRADAQQANTPGAKESAHLVLLGTSGGRTSWRGVQAAGISSAVVVNGHVYLVDLGDGWLRRYFQAGLGAAAPARGLESLRAAFITHLHADHVVDYPSLVLFGASDGLSERKSPVRVFGPGARGKLPPVSGSTVGVSGIVAPESPTPGTVAMTEAIYRAFATDINDNILDSRKPNPRTRVEVQDIVIPSQDSIDPNTDPAPEMAPFPVYQDENVKVTATLVSHPPVYPSFAFRFDTPDGSVVFSGDTSPSRNLIRLAQGADVLVHEVIDTAWVNALYPQPRNAAQEAKAHHLVHSHTAVEDVGTVAQAANVKVLVLSHLAPADNSAGRWTRAKEGFSGDVVVGSDLQWIPLRAKSRTDSRQMTVPRAGN